MSFRMSIRDSVGWKTTEFSTTQGDLDMWTRNRDSSSFLNLLVDRYAPRDFKNAWFHNWSKVNVPYEG